MKNEKLKIKTEGGQALLIGILLFLFLSTTFITGISTPILRHANVTNDFLTSRKSYFMSEAGIEDAVYRIKNNKQTSASETLFLDGVTVTTSIIDTLGTKTINTTANGKNLIRNLETVLKTGVGSSFSYGVQSGAGGFVLGNNATINGSVYSNGSITGSNGSKITGSAISAGADGLVDGVIVGSAGIGSAEAYQVKDSTVAGDLYCQIGSDNNKSCDTSKTVPVFLDFPVSDAEITQWKGVAAAGGEINGNYTVSTSGSLGPKKIIGDLTVGDHKVLTLTGTIWVTGKVMIENGGKIALSSTYGSNSGMLIADGTIDMSNNVIFAGSGQSGSYLMTLTTSDCPLNDSCNGDYAISVSNNVGAAVLNAQKGTIHMNNNAAAGAITGYKIIFEENADINYEQGIANTNFVNGPTGGWEINSWAETE